MVAILNVYEQWPQHEMCTCAIKGKKSVRSANTGSEDYYVQVSLFNPKMPSRLAQQWNNVIVYQSSHLYSNFLKILPFIYNP